MSHARSFDFVRYGIDGRRADVDPRAGASRSTLTDVGSARAFPPVDDKDFNFRSLRANAVFRWEVGGGPALDALPVFWQQIRSGTDAGRSGHRGSSPRAAPSSSAGTRAASLSTCTATTCC
jgi:hypothetical protein